jgi:uncharacterized membrane protein YgcG
MPLMRALVVVLIGLALPLGLALGVYAASSDSLAATPVVAPTGEVGRPAERVPPPTTMETTDTDSTTTTETEDEDSSGRGRGRGRGGDDSDNSGRGSDSSGSGSSGDDD